MQLSTYLDRLRAEQPLVHNITNYVAMNVAANVLLAIGASPAMLHAKEEAFDFSKNADALTINLGTISLPWMDGIRTAIAGAREGGTPWVLDPVAHFATQLRRDFVAELLELAPAVIRGNASEILALGGGAVQGKGADTGDSVAQAEDTATAIAKRYGCIVAVTGEVDFVTDGQRGFRVHGGSDLMPRVTALGCSLTGVMGGFAAVGADHPLEAAAAALAVFAAAGEQAAMNAKGPASFQLAFIDCLYNLQSEALDAKGRVVPA